MERIPDPAQVAASYNAEHGLPPLDTTAATVRPDPEKSAATARLYEKLKHLPHHPKIAAAYAAFKKEVLAQYAHLLASGVKIEPWEQPGQPYTSSDDMRRDSKNGHLFFYRTTPDQIPPDHPLAEPSPVPGLVYNDLFRAVHDYFGHSVHPHQFGPLGEIRAWAEHAKMFTPLARLAMTAETHGQNSWVNFAHNHQDIPLLERPYAEQKATVLPVTHYPVKLAREGLFTRAKKWLLGEKADDRFNHGANDGIIHKADTPDGFVKAAAEKSAVAQALQRLGSMSHRNDPAKHRATVDEHTRVAAWLAKQQPDAPVVKHYVQAAERLGAPDVVQPQPEPTKMGEWPEPPKHTHYTVASQGPAGKELTDAAIPLIRFVNTLLARIHNRSPLHQTEEGEPLKIEPPKPPEGKPYAPPFGPPAADPLKPASFNPKLADMRSFNKKHRSELEQAAADNPVLSIADDTTPIPLVNYRGETGPTGDRWRDIKRLTDAGHVRATIVRHLMDKYALSAQAAAATYLRWARRNLRLARLKLNRIRKEHLYRFGGKAVDPQIAGSRLAYHLVELATHYAKSNPLLASLAVHALHGTAPSGKNFDERGDPYYLLGLQLKAYQKPYGLRSVSADPNEPAARLAKAYRWDRMNDGLAAENIIKKFLRANIAGQDQLTDRELYTRAAASFGDKKHTPFWERVARWQKNYGTGSSYTQSQLQDALHRIADREEDRAELTPGAYHKPRDGDYHWKDYYRWNEETKHAKFNREKTAWISNKIRKLVKEGKDVKQAAAIAYSMWEQEHGA